MGLCVSNVLFPNRWHVAYFSSETLQQRLKSKLHKATWIGINGGLMIYFSTDLQGCSGCMDFFLRTERLLLVDMELWQKSSVFMTIFMYVYICNTEKKNMEGVQCLILWRFSETVFLCKFHIALKDNMILKLLSPLQQVHFRASTIQLGQMSMTKNCFYFISYH